MIWWPFSQQVHCYYKQDQEVFINSISDFCLQINKNKFVYDAEVLTLINCIFAEDRWSNLNCSHLLSQICLGLLFPLFFFCNSHVRVSHVIKLKLKPRRDGKPGWKLFFLFLFFSAWTLSFCLSFVNVDSLLRFNVSQKLIPGGNVMLYKT